MAHKSLDEQTNRSHWYAICMIISIAKHHNFKREMNFGTHDPNHVNNGKDEHFERAKHRGQGSQASQVPDREIHTLPAIISGCMDYVQYTIASNYRFIKVRVYAEVVYIILTAVVTVLVALLRSMVFLMADSNDFAIQFLGQAQFLGQPDSEYVVSRIQIVEGCLIIILFASEAYRAIANRHSVEHWINSIHKLSRYHTVDFLRYWTPDGLENHLGASQNLPGSCLFTTVTVIDRCINELLIVCLSLIAPFSVYFRCHEILFCLTAGQCSLFVALSSFLFLAQITRLLSDNICSHPWSIILSTYEFQTGASISTDLHTFAKTMWFEKVLKLSENGFWNRALALSSLFESSVQVLDLATAYFEQTSTFISKQKYTR